MKPSKYLSHMNVLMSHRACCPFLQKSCSKPSGAFYMKIEKIHNAPHLPMRLDPIRVALLDDHAIIRYGIAKHLSAEPGLDVVGEYETSRSMIHGFRENPADVILLDFALAPGEMDGVSLIRALNVKFPACHILVFSSHCDPATVAMAMKKGARGFIAKSEPIAQIVRAIRVVAEGRTYLSEDMLGRLDGVLKPARQSAEIAGNPEDSPFSTAQLSPREREVIRCFLEGLTITEIAEKFGRSVKTISTQKSMAYRKLGISTDQGLFKIRHMLEQE